MHQPVGLTDRVGVSRTVENCPFGGIGRRGAGRQVQRIEALTCNLEPVLGHLVDLTGGADQHGVGEPAAVGRHGLVQHEAGRKVDGRAGGAGQGRAHFGCDIGSGGEVLKAIDGVVLTCVLHQGSNVGQFRHHGAVPGAQPGNAAVRVLDVNRSQAGRRPGEGLVGGRSSAGELVGRCGITGGHEGRRQHLLGPQGRLSPPSVGERTNQRTVVERQGALLTLPAHEDGGEHTQCNEGHGNDDKESSPNPQASLHRRFSRFRADEPWWTVLVPSDKGQGL